MKVKVHAAINKIAYNELVGRLESAYAEIERLFQENKDLRVSECHVKDDNRLLRQMVAAQKETILKKDEEIKELSEEVLAAHNDKDSMKLRLNTAEVCVVNTQKNYDNLNTAFYENERKMASMTETNERLESMVENYQDEIASLREQLEALNEERDHFQKASFIWKEKAEAIQAARETAEGFADELRHQITSLDKRNMTLQNMLEKMESDNAHLLDENDILRHDNAEFAEEIARLEGAFHMAQESYIDKTAEVEEMKANYASLEEAYSQMSDRAACYFEKWNALNNQEVRAERFIKAMMTAIEKASADETAIDISEKA